jgi:hypothetical protein
VSRWSHLVDLLLGQPAVQTTPTTEPQETPMSTTKTSAQRLAAIDDELAAIEQAEIDDPISGATDLDAWSTRDSRRRTRLRQLEAEAREIQHLGELLDDPELAHTARDYTSNTAAFRRELAALRLPEGPDQHPNLPGKAGTALGHWCRAITKLARLLPVEDFPPAARFVDGEWRQWLAGRSMYLRLLAMRHGNDVAWPEGNSGELPGGARVGIYRPDGEA